MSEKTGARVDLDSSWRIREFAEDFYARVLSDPLLAPIFLDVARIDLAHHLPLICSYWEKLLLHKPGYARHTMNVHRALHRRQPLLTLHFERWLALFRRTLDEGFDGPGAERAWQIAQHVAANMQKAFPGQGSEDS